MKTTWDFVQMYYPNYQSCPTITFSDDLCKLLDEEYEIGDDAHTLLKEQYKGDVRNPEILVDYNTVMLEIYEKAIQSYINSQNNKSNI